MNDSRYKAIRHASAAVHFVVDGIIAYFMAQHVGGASTIKNNAMGTQGVNV